MTIDDVRARRAIPTSSNPSATRYRSGDPEIDLSNAQDGDAIRGPHPISMGVPASQERSTVTLEEAVRLAIDRYQDVGKARAAAEALKGKIREVRSQALPEIQIVSSAMRWRDPSLLNASGLDKFPEELRSALVVRSQKPLR